VRHIGEKPKPEVAPSTLAVVGRYVLDSRIFAHLRQTQAGAGGEIQLTDGIASLLKEQAVFAHRYDGIRYDCGNKEGMFKATIALGRKYHGLIP
jgi:UTP--glucose-1-phosphate uridylyltransferase